MDSNFWYRGTKAVDFRAIALEAETGLHRYALARGFRTRFGPSPHRYPKERIQKRVDIVEQPAVNALDRQHASRRRECRPKRPRDRRVPHRKGIGTAANAAEWFYRFRCGSCASGPPHGSATRQADQRLVEMHVTVHDLDRRLALTCNAARPVWLPAIRMPSRLGSCRPPDAGPKAEGARVCH